MDELDMILNGKLDEVTKDKLKEYINDIKNRAYEAGYNHGKDDEWLRIGCIGAAGIKLKEKD